MTRNHPPADEDYGFEFRHQYGEGKPEIIVRIHQDANLDLMAETFEGFLKAVGFSSDIEVAIYNGKDKGQ